MTFRRQLVLVRRTSAADRMQVVAKLGLPVEELGAWWLAVDTSQTHDDARLRLQTARASRWSGGVACCVVTVLDWSEFDVYEAGVRRGVFELKFDGTPEAEMLEELRRPRNSFDPVQGSISSLSIRNCLYGCARVWPAIPLLTMKSSPD